MGRRAKVPIAGSAKRLPLKLSDEVALDLWAFCEVHHGAPQSRVVEKAVKAFILEDLDKNPSLKGEWQALRDGLRPRMAPQVVKFEAPRAEGEE